MPLISTLWATSSLDPLPGYLPSVKSIKSALYNILVLCTLDFLIRNSEDDLNVAGVSLVWVDTTVGTVCATTGFGSLLDDDVFNEEVLEGERFCVGVRFGVL